MDTTLHDHVPLDAIVGTVQQSLDQIFRTAHPHLVYGQPIAYRDITVIPCAEVAVNLGFGGGGGSGSNPGAKPTGEKAHESAVPNGKPQIPESQGKGLGIGGGGIAKSRPVALIVMTPQGVRIQPILDVTKIALTAIITGGMAAWTLRPLLRLALRRQ